MSVKISPRLIIFHEPLYPEDYELRHYKYVDIVRGMLFSEKNNKIKHLKYLTEVKDLLGEEINASQKIIMSLKNPWRFLKKGFGELEHCSKLKKDLAFRNSCEERINYSRPSNWDKVNRRFNLQKIFLRLPYKDKSCFSTKDRILDASIARFQKNVHKYKNIETIGIEGKLSPFTIEKLDILNSLFSKIPTFQGFSVFLEDTRVSLEENWNNLALFKNIKSVTQYGWAEENLFNFIAKNNFRFCNLKKLSIGVFRNGEQDQNVSFVTNLEKLFSLDSLQLDASLSRHSLKSFLSQIKFPKHLSHLDLEMNTDYWDEIFSEAEPYYDFKEKFLSECCALENLESFKIIARKIDHNYPNKFVCPILEKLKHLKLFTLLCYDYEEEFRIKEGEFPTYEKIIDLGNMLNSIATASPSFKSLYINAPSLSIKHLQNETLSKLRLKRLFMSGTLTELKLVNNLYSLVNQSVEQSLFTLSEAHVYGKKSLKFVLDSLRTSTKSCTSDMVYICEYLTKSDFLEEMTAFLVSIERKDALYLEFKTFFNFQIEDLRKIGEILESKPKLRYLFIRGNNLSLSYRRSSVSCLLPHALDEI